MQISQIDRLISQASDEALTTTDYIIFGNDSDSDNIARRVVSSFVDDIAATETTKGTVERATDEEAATGTDTEKYITPAQLAASKDVQFKVTTISGDASTSPTTTTITHDLGTIPSEVYLKVVGSGGLNGDAYGWSEGWYDGTDEVCIYNGDVSQGTSSSLFGKWYSDQSDGFNLTVSDLTDAGIDIDANEFGSAPTTSIPCLIVFRK
jgi:hypothetical protein